MNKALTRPDAAKWKEAAQKEFDNLIANGSWEYCQLSPGAKAIECRWVFVVKYYADRSVNRYKHQEKYNASRMYLIALTHEMPEHLSKHCLENHVSVPESLFRMNTSSTMFLFSSIQM